MKSHFARIFFLIAGLSFGAEILLSLALVFTPTEAAASSLSKSSLVAEHPQEDQWYLFLEHLSFEKENEEELFGENLFFETNPKELKLRTFSYSLASPDVASPAISSNTPLYLRFCSLKIPFAQV